MKTLLSSVVILLALASAGAATTVNSTNKFAYGANIGWIDWRGDTTNGVVIGEYVCSGSVYSANVGWISFGTGAPANGIQYQNNLATDFGVNHDGLGNLRGYAYGANIGWINFDTNGAVKVDLRTGKLTGSIYSANCGWISLSNAFAFVQTDLIHAGTDSDGDGIADAWERLHFTDLSTASALTDFDKDGVSDFNEYLADTDPIDPNDALRIVSNSTLFTGGLDSDLLSWTSHRTRQYRIQYCNDLNPGFSWLDSGILFDPSVGPNTTASLSFGSPSAQRYFRIQALRPLP